MPLPNKAQLVQQEGRIALAIGALKQGCFVSVRAAAKAYDVPHSTLQNRVNGHPMQLNHRAPNCKLSNIEETTLVQWILSIDQRSLSPRPDSIRQMANLLLENDPIPIRIAKLASAGL
jgi:helix-turn-helix, Psq domain